MYKFYLPKGERVVTEYYNDLIKKSVKRAGKEITDIGVLGEIEKSDKVIVVSVRDALRVWIQNPKQHVTVWIQGVGAEESLTQSLHCFPIKWLKYYYYCCCEYLTLKKAKALFLVSWAMKEHFTKKYGSFKVPYIIMPCFNIGKLDIDSFYEERYASPTFVYAGGFQVWQCVDRMLLVFKEIQKLIPNAHLTILSQDLEIAKSSIEKMELNHVEAKYIPRAELDVEMRKYKYGFLLRENTVINKVATPTKMGTYLAAGIIPIFTTAVADFDNLLPLDEYGLKFNYTDSNLFIAKQIADFDMKEIDIEKMRETYQTVFSSYYSPNHYLNMIYQKNIF